MRVLLIAVAAMAVMLLSVRSIEGVRAAAGDKDSSSLKQQVQAGLAAQTELASLAMTGAQGPTDTPCTAFGNPNLCVSSSCCAQAGTFCSRNNCVTSRMCSNNGRICTNCMPDCVVYADGTPGDGSGATAIAPAHWLLCTAMLLCMLH